MVHLLLLGLLDEVLGLVWLHAVVRLQVVVAHLIRIGHLAILRGVALHNSYLLVLLLHVVNGLLVVVHFESGLQLKGWFDVQLRTVFWDLNWRLHSLVKIVVRR